MWICPKCERHFKGNNQSHSCTNITIDDLFVNKPDELLLAFDRLLEKVIRWEPTTVGAAKNALVFTSHKAWLIVRPMTKVLDIKFYYDEPIDSALLFKVQEFGGKYAHQIRINNETELTKDVFELLRLGFNQSLK